MTTVEFLQSLTALDCTFGLVLLAVFVACLWYVANARNSGGSYL